MAAAGVAPSMWLRGSFTGGAQTALLYSAIGAFHFIFRHKFLAISMDHKKAEASGLNVKFWDFLFYASFGFVVTSSVSIAGVLLVFCYLIVPSVAAMLYADSIGHRLAIGWSMGTLVSALGVYLSLQLDLPTGATIVCTFGLVLIIMAGVRPFVQESLLQAPTSPPTPTPTLHGSTTSPHSSRRGRTTAEQRNSSNA